MKFFSDMLQLSEVLLDRVLLFGADASHVLPQVFAWIFSAINAADLLLILLFCTGFGVFRTVFVQDRLSSFIFGKNVGNNVDAMKAKLQCVYDHDPVRPRCSVIRAQTAGQPPDLPPECTTVVLKNIPAKYTPDRLLAALHECGYFAKIDFVYVPVDFKSRDRSLGFAILSFSRTTVCAKFAAEFHLADACDMLGDEEDSKKCLEVSAAPIQGAEANVRHLQKSPVPMWLSKYPAWLPQIIDKGGLGTPLKAARSTERPRSPRRLTSSRSACRPSTRLPLRATDTKCIKE